MRTPKDKPEAHLGDELPARVQDLLRAERVPPPAQPGLETKLWARLENAPLMPATAGGVTSSFWGWGLGGVAVVGLVAVLAGVFSSDRGASPYQDTSASRPKEHESDPTRTARPGGEADPTRTARPGGEAGPTRGAHPEGNADLADGPGVAARPAPPAAEPAPPAAEPTPPSPQENPLLPAPAMKSEPGPAQEGAATAPSGPPRRDPVAERTLITQARTALRTGEPAAALTALAEHHRRFPRGELSEEREGLRVHALLAAGRHDDARKARARFLARFPQSIHAAGLESLDL